VVGRSALHGAAMLIYFGCLAFLPVAQVAAGLFTAPIFVLVIARLVYGHALGPARIAAAAVGFLGVILALTPGTDAPLGLGERAAGRGGGALRDGEPRDAGMVRRARAPRR
jgi:drug/metabolite transporter (DMT)-like permease